MQNVLLVEDSPDFQLLVKKSLGSSFSVTCVEKVSDAMEAATRGNFDVVLIDVVLPEGDGFQFCAELRSREETREIPVIFLTGKSKLADKIMGFSLGADDYVVKPFEPLELKARIESKLRRLRESQETNAVLKKGDLIVRVPFQKAYLVDQASEQTTDLDLTPIEFKLLYCFIRREGHVLSRMQLLEAIWGENVHVLDRTVDKHIFTLRQKLGRCAPYIQTVSGVGYRFDAETTLISQ